MNDTVNFVLLKQGTHFLKIADVGLDKGVVRLVLNILEVSEVTGVGEGIQIDDVVIRVLVHEEANYM